MARLPWYGNSASKIALSSYAPTSPGIKYHRTCSQTRTSLFLHTIKSVSILTQSFSHTFVPFGNSLLQTRIVVVPVISLVNGLLSILIRENSILEVHLHKCAVQVVFFPHLLRFIVEVFFYLIPELIHPIKIVYILSVLRRFVPSLRVAV